MFWQLRKSNYSFLFVVSCFFFRNSENLGVEENQSLCTLQFATLALSNFGFRKRPPPDGVAPRLWGEGMLMQGACTAGCFSRLCPLSIEFASWGSWSNLNPFHPKFGTISPKLAGSWHASCYTTQLNGGVTRHEAAPARCEKGTDRCAFLASFLRF